MKLIVVGPRGKMGRLITQIAAGRDDLKLIAGVAPKGRDYIGKDLGAVTAVGYDLGVPVVDDLESVIDTCDVIIDFSTKEMAMEVVKLAVKHKKALVCGTTGFSTAGATFADVELFAKHVGPDVKIKAAGGISSMEDAEKFVELGASRLGTSRIVKIVKNQASDGGY